MESIGDRLRQIIDELEDGNLSKFARKTGISQGALYKYEKGRPPHAEFLISVRNIYNAHTDWILTGKGPKYVDDSEGAAQAGPTDVDTEILERIMAFLEGRLAGEGVVLPPKKKARFVALAYEYFTKEDEEDAKAGSRIDKPALEKLFNLVV